MVEPLNLLGWLVCVVYATIPGFWLLVHPRVEYWRSGRRSPYTVLLPAWIVMWALVALATARWRKAIFYSSPWYWVPALALFGAGIWLYFQSGRNFSVRQLSGLPEIVAGHSEQRLVTTGIRARVRHPVYLAHFCEMFGWSIGTGLVVCYGLTVFAILTAAVMVRMEDRELEARFGEEHRQYARRVPAILPKLRAGK